MKRKFFILGLVLFVAACGTSREPNFFSLAATPGLTAPQLETVIKVDRPILAGYLDRPEFVSQNGTYQLLIDDADQWAEPLDTMFARILAADLQGRLPASTVVSEDDKTPSDTRFTVVMNLQRLNATDEGNAIMQGNLVVKDAKADRQLPPLPVQGTVDSGRSPAEIAEGLSQLIGCLADQIVATLVLLDTSPPPMLERSTSSPAAP